MENKIIKGTACILTGLMAFSMTFGALNFNSQTQQTVYAGSITDSSISDENIKGDVNADGSFDVADVLLEYDLYARNKRCERQSGDNDTYLRTELRREGNSFQHDACFRSERSADLIYGRNPVFQSNNHT